MREALKKVPGGKTVKVEVVVEGGVLRDVLISGDFFAYPPEAIEEMESSLRGVRADPEAVERVVMSFRGKLQLVGISLEDIVELLREALGP